MIRINYELTVDDVVNFNYEHWRAPFNAKQRKKWFRDLSLNIVIGILAGLALAMLVDVRRSSIIFAVVVGIAYAVIRILANTFFLKISIRNKVHKQLEDRVNRNMLLPFELSISGEIIRSVDTVSDITYN
jgi:hypothetical protein